MAVYELGYDVLREACRIGVERSLVGLVQDLLEGQGHVWGSSEGAGTQSQDGKANRDTHLDVRKDER